ncbi:hypothetical protein GEMRC1_002173 [Eukaryota sp. GEM-RC1]
MDLLCHYFSSEFSHTVTRVFPTNTGVLVVEANLRQGHTPDPFEILEFAYSHSISHLLPPRILYLNDASELQPQSIPYSIVPKFRSVRRTTTPDVVNSLFRSSFYCDNDVERLVITLLSKYLGKSTLVAACHNVNSPSHQTVTFPNTTCLETLLSQPPVTSPISSFEQSPDVIVSVKLKPSNSIGLTGISKVNCPLGIYLQQLGSLLHVMAEVDEERISIEEGIQIVDKFIAFLLEELNLFEHRKTSAPIVPWGQVVQNVEFNNEFELIGMDGDDEDDLNVQY